MSNVGKSDLVECYFCGFGIDLYCDGAIAKVHRLQNGEAVFAHQDCITNKKQRRKQLTNDQ